jgi:large subunit ribosomal protein L25
MSELTIEVTKREQLGKNANRRLRASGQIPAVVYGGGLDPLAISVSTRKIEELLRTEGGEHAVFQLQLGDKSRHAMIREVSHEATTRRIQHIDFQRVMMDQKVRVLVALHLVKEAEGAKAHGGLLDFVMREVHVEVLPSQIPAHIDIDVSVIKLGEHIEAKDLTMPEGVTLSEDGHRVILTRSINRAADDDVAAETAEPEVVAKGKKPTE